MGDRRKHPGQWACQLTWKVIAHHGEWEGGLWGLQRNSPCLVWTLLPEMQGTASVPWPAGMRQALLQCLGAICQHGPSNGLHQQAYTPVWCPDGVCHAGRILPNSVLWTRASAGLRPPWLPAVFFRYEPLGVEVVIRCQGVKMPPNAVSAQPWAWSLFGRLGEIRALLAPTRPTKVHSLVPPRWTSHPGPHSAGPCLYALHYRAPCGSALLPPSLPGKSSLSGSVTTSRKPFLTLRLDPLAPPCPQGPSFHWLPHSPYWGTLSSSSLCPGGWDGFGLRSERSCGESSAWVHAYLGICPLSGR